LGLYAGSLRDCVVALKYRGRHRTAERLALRLLERERGRAVLFGADALIGVPLHPDRLKERGFNQAALLAEALGRNSGLPVLTALIRNRNTPSQTHLSAKDRRRNVARAFQVREPAALLGATVVLVDDVATTGATLRECAATLLAAGVAEVRAITVARAE
jgi:ComF family protein